MDKIRQFLEVHGGVASVSEMAGLLGVDENLVRRWARENDVRRLGAVFAFDCHAAAFCAEELVGEAKRQPEQKPMSDQCMQPLAPLSASPDDLRALGWSVAVHNDYRLNGESHTFWLLVKGRIALKGEGRTDWEALNQIRVQVVPPLLPLPRQPPGDDDQP